MGWVTPLLTAALELLTQGVPAAARSAQTPHLATSPQYAIVYEGEELSLAYELIFSERAPAVMGISPPSHPRVLLTEIPTERLITGKPEQASADNMYRARIASYSIIPLEAGTHEISGYSILAVTEREGTASPDSLILAAPALTLEARALPPGAPDSYSGSVGRFTLEASLSSDTVSTGEPVTAFITVTGNGISVLEGDLELHLPENASTITSSHSSRKVSHTFRTTEPGSCDFTPATLTYFDPALHQYTSIAAPHLQLTVTEALPSQLAQVPANTRPTTSPVTGKPWPGTLTALTITGILAAILLFLILLQNRKSVDRPQLQAKKAPKPPVTILELRSRLHQAILNASGADMHSHTRKELLHKLAATGAPTTLCTNLQELLEEMDRIEFSQENHSCNTNIEQICIKAIPTLTRLENLRHS